MIVEENVLFYMPMRRELQFPAMSALQSYVNHYETKMRANCILKTLPDFRLCYWCDMSEEDWLFWQDIGIDLKQLRGAIGYPDAVIHLEDWRIQAFHNNDKHAAQICSAIAGVEGLPFPRIRQVKPDFEMKTIWTLGIRGEGVEVTGGDVKSAVDGQVGCVVGYQSWETYLAAAMGLPVVEILQRRRSPNWLSKWMNPLYRMVEEERIDLIPQALSNIREVLQCLSNQDRHSGVVSTQTVP